MNRPTPDHPEVRWFWGVSPWIFQVLGFALLAIGIVMPKLAGYTGNQPLPNKAVRSQLTTLRVAVDLYARDHGAPPTTAQGLSALLGRYLDNVDTIPPDPWGNPYRYEAAPIHPRGFRIMSYGADGKPGGDGLNRDLLTP